MNNSQILTSVLATLALGLAYVALPIAQADPSVLWACKGITVDQKGPPAVSVGDRIDYEIHVRNTGDCDLSDSSVVDFIPRMTTFFEASPKPTEFPATRDDSRFTSQSEHPVSRIEWKNILLGAGKEVTFTLSAHVRSPEDRILLNTVCFENPQTGRICSQVESNVLKRP
ncbi:MAG: hypothetical protein ACJ763_15070 [Bdellovibrionia bacterium]